MRDLDLHESPDEAAGARFMREFREAAESYATGAMVLATPSGASFYVSCSLCLGDERRKAPRRYQDKLAAQAAADEHNAQWHKERP